MERDIRNGRVSRIVKIWFDGEWLYGMAEDGNTYRQSLIWYKHLWHASQQEREAYEVSETGFHWRALDEDISFESFFYEDAEPSTLQRFFLTHPEINISGFSERFGFNASLIRNYVNGFKKPSPEKEKQILEAIATLGKEYISLTSARLQVQK